MKKIISMVLLACMLSGCGLKSSNDDDITNEQKIINYKEVAEEYNPAKEYNEGEIVYYEGEVGSIEWFNDPARTYHFDGCGIVWYETSDFIIKNYCEELKFGGLIKVYGEPLSKGSKSFWIRDLEVLKSNIITLDYYIDERVEMDTNGLSLEEAKQLNEWCEFDEKCKMFEEALDNNIYNIYPELTK